MSITKFIITGAVAFVAVTGALIVQPSFVRATSDCTTNGTTKKDFTGEWISRDTVKFSTTNNVELCQDVEVYVSSYTMPDNYNGEKFYNNPTATPQVLFASKKLVLEKGTTGSRTVTIDVPSVCKNVQTDAYLAPEVKVVGPSGHEGRAFATQITKKVTEGCEVVKVKACNTDTKTIVEVEKGKENTPPYTSDLKKCEVAQIRNDVTELPKTGPSDALVSVLPFGAIAAAAMSFINSRRQ